MSSHSTPERVATHCVISPILIDVEVVEGIHKIIALFVVGVLMFRECGSLLVRILSIVLLVE
jgi:hypothetical protein